MSGIASAIGAAAAVAGAASSIYGSMKKGQGVRQNTAAQGQILLEDLERQKRYSDEANRIAQWYGNESSNLFQGTFAKASPAFNAEARATSEADRVKRGTDILATSADPVNATALAPQTGGSNKQAMAAALAEAAGRARHSLSTGAKVNSFGDANTQAGINLARGAQDQDNLRQIAGVRTRLNNAVAVPVLSSEAKYKLAGGEGADAFNTGSMIQAGGNLISAAGAYGVPQDAWDWMFRSSVPSQPGVYGPQQPGIFTRAFT